MCVLQVILTTTVKRYIIIYRFTGEIRTVRTKSKKIPSMIFHRVIHMTFVFIALTMDRDAYVHLHNVVVKKKKKEKNF